MAKRLRGVFSCGLLTSAPKGSVEGEDVAKALRITRHEDELESDDQRRHHHQKPSIYQGERNPGYTVVYDMLHLRHLHEQFVPGEEVVATEKIHGESAIYLFRDGRLHVSSHTKFKKDPVLLTEELVAKGEPPASPIRCKWWEVARLYDVESAISRFPGLAFYGEVHGYTGGFPYGTDGYRPAFRVFDILDTCTKQWLDHDDIFAACAMAGLPTCPVLYRGPWKPAPPETPWALADASLLALAEGPSTVDPSHIREGFVIRPIRERTSPEGNRLVAKVVGEAYLEQKYKKKKMKTQPKKCSTCSGTGELDEPGAPCCGRCYGCGSEPYCSVCGAELTDEEARRTWVCATCAGKPSVDKSTDGSHTRPAGETAMEREYMKIVSRAQRKSNQHAPSGPPDGETWIWAVTTLAQSQRCGGTRTPVICSTFKQATEIVDNNHGDIYEHSYLLVVIEAIRVDRLYGAVLGESFWYAWFADEGYKPIETPEEFRNTFGHGVG
jgi:RNA ligase (TIGR02306 family)